VVEKVQVIFADEFPLVEAIQVSRKQMLVAGRAAETLCVVDLKW
jgi:hypothetical protein